MWRHESCRHSKFVTLLDRLRECRASHLALPAFRCQKEDKQTDRESDEGKDISSTDILRFFLSSSV